MQPTESTLGLVLYSIILIVSLLLFSFFIYKRFQIMRVTQKEPVNRWDNMGKRVGAVLKFFIGQARILDKRFISAGMMHAFIFWGFLAVTFNTIHMLVGGFIAGFHLPLLSPGTPLGNVYTVFRDIFEILVLIMVVYALFRRMVIKPERVTLSAEANLVLILIAILMVTDFLMGGAKVSAGIQNEISPASELTAALIANVNSNSISLVYNVSWWAHIVALLFFLNLLPNSKHFHVITSLPNVFMRRFNYGSLRHINLEEAENFGVSQIEHSTWKDILDIYTCTECGRCQDVCPAFNTGKLLSPKQINVNSRHHLYEEKTPFILQMAKQNNGAEYSGKNLVGDVVPDEMLWACTTCKACEEACPLFIEYIDRIVDMRRYLVLEEGKMAPELATTFKNLENQGNPWGLAAESRDDWAEGLNVPKINEDTEVLYWIGCSGSFDDRNVSVTKAMVKILNAAEVNYGILGKQESCTGDPARRAGNEYLYQILAETNIQTLNNLKFKKIITQCPHCFNTLKNEYPQLGGNYHVQHHSQFLNELIAEGRIRQKSNSDEKKITFHDPCYLGRHNEEYNAPREVLKSTQARLLEMEKSKNNSFCCGAGGAQMWKEEEKGNEAVRRERLKHAQKTGAEMIGTGCPFCMTMMNDANNELDANMAVKDIAEIVAERLV